MKLSIKAAAAIACTALCALSLTACNHGKSTLLGKAAKPVNYYPSQVEGTYNGFTDKVEEFASTFAEHAYKDYDKGDNFAVSPISVYMALSLAAECSSGQTRTEVLNALGVTYEQLEENFPLLFQSLAREYTRGNKVTSVLIPTNSIWITDGIPVNDSCIDTLANRYFCYSYAADFIHDNANANKAVRYFVKEQTKGLIDKDFNISNETFFTLINTLYLKTIWNKDGDNLSFTSQSYDFKTSSGTTQTKLLQGYYRSGRVYETDRCSAFYTSSYNGYKIKFIVPKDGYTVDDVFTADTLYEVNSITDYNSYDHENMLHYNTRCLFPEYHCDYDGEINNLLKNKFGINRLFNDPYYFPDNGCEFETLTTEKCYCGRVQHVTDLTVSKKGIEGAAVTVLEFPGAGAPGPNEYEEVYEDFVVDRSFGFIITDSYNITLFSGVVDSL